MCMCMCMCMCVCVCVRVRECVCVAGPDVHCLVLAVLVRYTKALTSFQYTHNIGIYIYMRRSHPLHTPQCMVGVARNPRVVSIMVVIPTPGYVKAYVTVTVDSLINPQIAW